MAIRTISAVIALPFLIFLVMTGGVVLQVSTLAISLLGMFELYRAFFKEHKVVNFVGYVACCFFVLGIDILNLYSLSLIISFLVLISFIIMVINHSKLNIEQIVIVIFGFFYVPFMLINIYLTRQIENGSYFVWLIFISSFGCDTGAYLFGKSFGKKKLIPSLSPNKTIAGAIGGVFTAGVMGGLFGLFVANKITSLSPNTTILGSILICSVGAVFAQFGDLTGSAIKRHTGIKDFGNIMPGHGGVMDRFDSVLFTAPIIYYGFILLTYLYSVNPM